MHLIIKIPAKVKQIIRTFHQSGGEIYIVGGAVRDLLIKKQVKDWDFATNLTPAKMKAIFPKNSFYENNFGTFSIVGRGQIYEITTYRSEDVYTDFRRPDKVSWGKTIHQDLHRRDFTIDAIALKPIFKNDDLVDFDIIDPFDGQKDLLTKKIKAVGSPDQRFTEDALRLMRAIRIATQIKFSIDPATLKSIQKNAELIKKIAWERIRDELFKILASDNCVKGMTMLKDSGLLNHIIPELLPSVGLKQKGHHIYDVWKHSIKALKFCQSDDPVTKLAALLHDVAKSVVVAYPDNQEPTFHNHEVVGARMAVTVGKRLRLSNKQLDKLFKLVRWHMFTGDDKQTDKSVRRIIKRVTPDYLDDLIALRRADRLGSGAKETSWRWELLKKRFVEVQKQPFSIKDLKINGQDIMKLLNIKPGPKVGDILQKLFDKVEKDPTLNTKVNLKKLAKQLSSCR